MRIAAGILLAFLWVGYAFAQGAQCRTSPVGTSTAYCGSEAFVTNSIAAIPAGGNVTGPASSTTGHVATFAGTTGKVIQDGGAPATGTVISVACGTGLSGGTITNTGTCSVNLTTASNILSGNVSLNNTSNFFDGPSVAQGTSGTWWASGNVTLSDSATVADFICKLWDGTTVISAAASTSESAGHFISIALSGYLASPAANIKISCRDLSATTGTILSNSTGTSKDSTISVHRVQ